MLRRLRALALGVGILALLAGCATPSFRGESECLAPSRVGEWKTVAWQGPPATQSQVLDERTESVLEAALIEAVQQVGLQLASPSAADLLMAYRLQTAQYADPRLVSGEGWGCWGRKAPEATPRTYTEATLLVEMTERATGEVVWRARVQHTLTEADRINPAGLAQQAAEAVLAQWPVVP